MQLANGNSREAVRIYVTRYPNRHVPAHQTFRRARSEGGLRRRLRDVEMEEEILEHFQNNSTTSTRSVVRVLHLN